MERRRARRSKVFWGAQISFDEYFEPFNCTLRDISGKGARLGLEKNVKLPDRFRVWAPARQMHVNVRLVWRNGQTAGIMFEGFEPPKYTKTR